MKTMFYKKGIILLATLFVAGITLSCQDADDGEEQQDQQQSTWKFQIGKFVKHVDDITATVHFNQTLGEWYLMYHVPFTIDSVYNYYPYGLGKFQQEDLKVVFSGDVYEIDIKSGIAGCENFFVAVTSIREWTEDDRLGYWGDDDFIELLCCDPNIYYVQARATGNPISYERVEEILTSLGAEITYSSGTSFFLVNAKQRPVHPDLYVSPYYKPIDRRWWEFELWIYPRISIYTNEGASWNEILSKYGTHLRERERFAETPKELRSFDCDLPTAEEILRLASTIHLDPNVNWCAPSLKTTIILDYGTKTNVLQIDSEDY